MKRTLLILLSLIAICSCSKESLLHNTSWHGEIVSGVVTKSFDVHFNNNGTCTWCYQLNNSEDPAKDSMVASQVPYTYDPPKITIKESNVSYGAGNTGATNYPDITGTVQGRSMTLTVRGDVFEMLRR